MYNKATMLINECYNEYHANESSRKKDRVLMKLYGLVEAYINQKIVALNLRDKSLGEDIKQIHLIKIYECLTDYQPSLNISFRTYLQGNLKWCDSNFVTRTFKKNEPLVPLTDNM